MSAPNCCDIEEKSESFVRQPEICEEDYLSQLPDDCLLTIADYLNIDDMDVVSTTSQRMMNFIAHARKMRKFPADELHIYKNESGQIGVCLTRNYRSNYYMLMNIEDGEYEDPECYKARQSRDDYAPFSVPDGNLDNIPCSVFKCIQYLSDRFNIAYLRASSIRIDRQFLSHYQNAFNFKSIGEIVINFECEHVDEKEVVNWIASKNPNEFVAFRSSLEQERETEFMDMVIRTVSCDAISIYYRDDPQGLRRYPMPESFYGIVSKMKHFASPSFVVEPDRLMDFIYNRIKLQAKGRMSMGTTTAIDSHFIRAAIQHSECVECNQEGDIERFAFTIALLKWTATFLFWKNNALGFDVIFAEG